MTTTATATTRLNVAGFSGTYEITRGRARVIGYFRDASFPNEKSVPDMGEVFYVEVPEGMRRRGLGYTLVADAIKLMRRKGAKTVVMRGKFTDGGRAIVAKLVRNGLISPAKRTAASGTSIHDILIGVSEHSEHRVRRAVSRIDALLARQG